MKPIRERLAEPSSQAGLGLILLGVLVVLGVVPMDAAEPALAQYGGGGGIIGAGLLAVLRKEGGTR